MILHIVGNPVTHDSRILRETKALQDSGIFGPVEIAGFMEHGYAPYEKLDDGRTIWRASLATRPLPKDLGSQAVKFMEWYARVVQRYRRMRIKVIHCHDLAPLPIALGLKRLTGARVVYDAHELETERAGSQGPRRLLACWFEQNMIKSVDAMITVSPSIRDWYAARYPDVPVSLVRNVPEKPSHALKPKPLRTQFQVPDNALLFIYMGALQKGRGVERILQAFQDDRVRHHVVFMGSGLLKKPVEQAAGLCSRIHYLPPVLPEEVLSYAAGTDVGLCFIDDICLSYRYCLPNKLFETLLAGVPVLASDLPDQAEIVRKYGCGWVVSNRMESLAEFLIHLDVDRARQLREEVPERVRELSWENEQQELLRLYHNLFGR